jgi:hypothetical protein
VVDMLVRANDHRKMADVDVTTRSRADQRRLGEGAYARPELELFSGA